MAKTVQKAVSVGVLVLSVFGFANAAQANLITNGSFEDITNFMADPGHPGDDTARLPVSSTAMTDWTVVNSGLAWIGPKNPFGLTASNGNYFLDLTDYTDAAPYGGVQQVITTVPGGQYRLTFNLGSSSTFGIPDSITASAGSGLQTFTSTLTGTDNGNPKRWIFSRRDDHRRHADRRFWV